MSLAQRPKRFETEKSAVRRSALRCLRRQYDEKIRRQGKRPPSMRPLLSSDLFFGSECGGNAASQRSRRMYASANASCSASFFGQRKTTLQNLSARRRISDTSSAAGRSLRSKCFLHKLPPSGGLLPEPGQRQRFFPSPFYILSLNRSGNDPADFTEVPLRIE